MNDLAIIQEIEKQIEIPLQQMEVETLTKDINKPIRGYVLDENGAVAGLRLNNTGFQDEKLLTKLTHLNVLVLRYNYLKNYEFLKNFQELTKLYITSAIPVNFSMLSELKGLTSLDLGSNNLTDVAFLRKLKGLNFLNLSGNKLTDVAFLHKLKGLTALNLSDNKLTDMALLCELKGLTDLNLRDNKLTDVAFLRELKSLTALDLSWNQLIDVAFLRELKSLTFLNMLRTDFTDVSFLCELKGLTYLNLGSNNLKNVTSVRELKGLTSLNISENNLTDITFLGELKNLTSLDLSINNLSNVAFLRQLKNLISLDLIGNQLTDVAFFGELKSLDSLYLGDTNLTDVAFLRELKGLTSLDLGWNNLTDVSFLHELKNLTYLNLSGNNLTNVTFLRELKGLTTLHLMSNNLTSVASLYELQDLTFLDLSGNKLTDVTFLYRLKDLTYLDLSNNQLTDVAFLRKLKDLSSLYLESNNLTDVASLRELKGLTSLDLSNNQLTNFTFLYELKNLTHLGLGSNNLADVVFLRELKGLTSLDLKENDLTDVSFIVQLPFIRYIDLSENPNLKEPPQDIIEKGIEAIRSYFLQKALQGVDYLYEAKTLFVGEPGAGKTSLMKKLLDPDYLVPNPEPEKQEKSTLGIEIEPNWSFPYLNDPKIHFKAHLWDFGGQNIQYYIHQFFLTERSLYILLVEDRKDCPNIDYWFNIIKLLGKGSPVILVRNEKQIDSATGFDYAKYQQRYKDSFPIEYRSLNLSRDRERILEITQLIQHQLSHLKHIGDELPAGWVEVRKKLAALKSKNHIMVSEFQQICRDYQILSEGDQLVVCGYLHDLGILLHYRTESALADTVFLNPLWIINAVYTILSDKKLEEQNGRFSREWLFDKWGDNYTYEEKNKILLLMQKKEFDLCYPLNSAKGECFLAPQLLPDVTPTFVHQWERQDCLNYRYRYAFMPVGIITRIIVRLSQWISEEGGHDLVWRSGVILQKENCQALIKEDFTRDGLRVIDISVKGEDYSRKDFLAYIRGTIDEIHQQSFKEIQVEQLVPCSCEVCLGAADPMFFELSRLRDYIEAGEQQITCEKGKPFRKVAIEKLLEGVVRPQPLRTKMREFPGEDKPEREHLEFVSQLIEKSQDSLVLLLRELVYKSALHTEVNVNVSSGPAISQEKRFLKKFGRFLRWLLGALASFATIALFVKECYLDPKAQSTKTEQIQPSSFKPIPDSLQIDTSKVPLNSEKTDSTGKIEKNLK